MPHRDIMTHLLLFDTVKYRLEYWAKRFDQPIGELATQLLSTGLNGILLGCTKEKREQEVRGEVDYIARVRWDNQMPLEEAWEYVEHYTGIKRPLPKTIRKGVKRGF